MEEVSPPSTPRSNTMLKKIIVAVVLAAGLGVLGQQIYSRYHHGN